jgi:hypothetical protein
MTIHEALPLIAMIFAAAAMLDLATRAIEWLWVRSIKRRMKGQ